MSRPLRLLALAVAVSVAAGSGLASAQTLYVRDAPPDSAVELVVNTETVGSAKTNAAGDAVIPFDLVKTAGSNQVDANIFVDVCDSLHRIVVVARGMAAAAEQSGCDRRAVSGVFLMRTVTSLVVRVGSAVPSVLLVQGPYSLEPQGPSSVWSGVPSGFVLFGGAGTAGFRDAAALACGNAPTCSNSGSWGGLTAGADFWLAPFLAATGSFMKPRQLDITGGGDTFDFNSFVDAYVLTVGGKFGVPVGPVRMYGHVGGAYHRAVTATNQTMDETTITVNGEEQTVPGGSQAFELETEGWGVTFGGGVEAWITPHFGFYGDVSRTSLKGDAIAGEGEMDDWVTSITFGIRLGIH